MVDVDPGGPAGPDPSGGAGQGHDTGPADPAPSPLLVHPSGPAPRLRRLLGRRTTPAAASGAAAMDVLTAGVRMAAMLRDGLAAPAAVGVTRRLRKLLGADALGLVDLDGARTWAGSPPAGADELVADVLRTDRRSARDDAIALPLHVRDEPAGVLVVVGVPDGAARQAAAWVADALHRGRLEASADAAEQAELRALRAEISPHFVYYALSTIASFVRSDPARARELLLDFAL